MAIYLGFAKVLPFNGGELIYVSPVIDRPMTHESSRADDSSSMK